MCTLTEFRFVFFLDSFLELGLFIILWCHFQWSFLEFSLFIYYFLMPTFLDLVELCLCHDYVGLFWAIWMPPFCGLRYATFSGLRFATIFLGLDLSSIYLFIGATFGGLSWVIMLVLMLNLGRLLRPHHLKALLK